MASYSSDSESSNYSIDNELTPKQASSLRKNNDIVLIKGKPCKIVDMFVSKPGKHGHSKIHFVGLDIFTGNRYEYNCPSSKNMMVPNVTKKEFYVSILLLAKQFSA